MALLDLTGILVMRLVARRSAGFAAKAELGDKLNGTSEGFLRGSSSSLKSLAHRECSWVDRGTWERSSVTDYSEQCNPYYNVQNDFINRRHPLINNDCPRRMEADLCDLKKAYR